MAPESDLVKEWLAKADDDLRLADLAISADPPVCWGAAFHAEQAAEKLLKGMLSFRNVEFEKSHSIDYLLDLCVTVEPRYPFPRTDPDEAEAAEAIQTARLIRQFVQQFLPSELWGTTS